MISNTSNAAVPGVSRRDFLSGAFASLGAGAFGGRIFAAPAGWKPKKKPNLVFGVVSDTHMRCHYDGKNFYSHYAAYYDDQALVEVMKVFKRAGVDAILHCGDITDGGMVREMLFYKEAWDKVYGSGPRPANLMVTGNHDVAESYYWAQCVSRSKDPAVYKKIRLGLHNIKQEMERIWGEPYDDVWHKTVKDYHFFGFGWPMWPEEGMKGDQPYKGWLYHYTPDEGDKPRFARGFGDGTVTGNMDAGKADHALLVRVYDDMVRISRIWVNVRPKHVVGSLGEDWVMPLNWGTGNGEQGTGGSHPLKAENYVKVIGSPEFPKGAKLEVFLDRINKIDKIENAAPTQENPVNPVNPVKKEPAMRIRIPKADGNHDCRVYGYQIAVAGDDRATMLKRNVYARGYCMGVGYEPDGGVTTLEIPAAELPAGKKLTIAVRPCSSLGTKGKAIGTTLRV